MRSTLWLPLGALMLAMGPSAAQDAPRLEVLTPTVGQYDKAEFEIHVAQQYERPFDPAAVEVCLDITSPSGARLSVPAFYYQGYERRRIMREGRAADWLYPERGSRWLARCAPSEVGTYTATAHVVDADGEAVSEPVRFECTPSDRKGFLRASKADPRFLEFSTGEPFFAIGQDLAFIGEGQYADLSRAEAIFAKLHASGANFLRVWTCCDDWAMAIESPKSAWDRSWDRNAAIVPRPGAPDRKCVELSGDSGKLLRVDPSHPVALKPNTLYRMTGSVRTDDGARVSLRVGPDESVALGEGDGDWHGFAVDLRSADQQYWLGTPAFVLTKAGKAWLGDLQLAEADGGPNLLWEADVDRPPRGYYNPVDCFVLDELVGSARDNGIYLMLCLITRDLYMSALSDDASPEYAQATSDAKNLLRYAVARWGYSTSVAAWEYWNEMDPGKPTGRFYQDLGDYLPEIDPYHRLKTTSDWASCPRDWEHPAIDVAQEHFYLRPSDRERVPDEVSAILERSALLREHATAKPALLGEFGLATEQWGLSDSMKADSDLVHFHNALWASALSGLSGTAMFWWWEQLDQMDAYRHYRPLADFVADIPFTTAGLAAAAARVSDPRVQLVGLQREGCFYGWLLNTAATWTSIEAGRGPTEDISGATLTVRGLAPGACRVEWWDTHTGKVTSSADVTVGADPCELLVPPFRADIACKMVRR